MRAWITTIRPDGSECIGSEWQWVSKEYRTMSGLYKYAVLPKLIHAVTKRHANKVKVSIHYNWDTRYGKADKTYVFTYQYPKEMEYMELPPAFGIKVEEL